MTIYANKINVSENYAVNAVKPDLRMSGAGEVTARRAGISITPRRGGILFFVRSWGSQSHVEGVGFFLKFVTIYANNLKS